MANYTLSYSPQDKGWTSFHSYAPEWMIGMNSVFYSFFQGNLWQHYDNATRNNYYGAQYTSQITPVINNDPISAKMFKTINLETNSPWDATITTDMSTGFIDSTHFVLKEGEYYSYIRRVAGNIDLDLLSAQGIGEVTTVTGTSPGSIDFTFAFDIGSIISVGDVLYRDNSGIQLIGTITALSSTVVTVAVTSITPVAGDLILYIKDAQAESYGARGYYMEVHLENFSTSEVELFSISSEVFKSFP